jgi:hypothetical protein
MTIGRLSREHRNIEMLKPNDVSRSFIRIALAMHGSF